MRQIIVGFLLAVTFCYCLNTQINANPSIDPYILEDVINETLQGLLADLPEPIEVDTLSLSFPEDEGAIVTGTANITDLSISGLKSVHVEWLDFEIIGVELNFTAQIDTIHLFTKYSLDLNIANALFLYGDGNVTADIGDLQIEGSGQANLTGGIQIENLRVQPHIGDAKFEIHGLLNDEDLSELLGDILTDLVAEFVDDNPELAADIVSPIVEGLINSLLNNLFAPTTEPPAATSTLD